MQIIMKPLSELKPYESNPRNNDRAVKHVMASIKEFGFRLPIIIDRHNVIVAGHTRYKAAKKLKLTPSSARTGYAAWMYWGRSSKTPPPCWNPTGSPPSWSARCAARTATMDKWDECGAPFDIEELEGRTCYAGLDLSSTTNLTALVLAFPPEDTDEPYKVLPFFWLPEETLPLRVRRDHVPYDNWGGRTTS